MEGGDVREVDGGEGEIFKVMKERKITNSSTNVFPRCSHSNQTPGPLMPSLTDYPKEEEEEEKKTSYHRLSAGRCNLFGIISNEPGQGHDVSPPLRDLEDVLTWSSLEKCSVMKQI